MISNTFNFIKLWPDFGELLNGNFSTAHGFSAVVVAFLFFVFLISLLVSFFKFFKAHQQIIFFRNLLKDITAENLVSRRRDLLNRARNSKPGKLWIEFDESLVLPPDGKRLYNTLDASHFFNTSSLGCGLIDNRLIAAVPGFLTAIGVLGTFAGLQMGLGTLELNKDAGVEVLRAGIGHMISGASIAFLTSVWGVLTSVLFNFIEKFLERKTRKQITELQKQIDYLFPRITPEEVLLKIEDYTKNSDQTLAGLAEKIGDRMQETLLEVNRSIQQELTTSLEKILRPALEKLAEEATHTSTNALESIVDAFLERARELGKKQQVEMEQAAANLNKSVEDLNNVIFGFSEKIENNTRESERVLQDALLQFAKNIEKIQTNSESMNYKLLNNMERNLELIGKRFDHIVNTIGHDISSLLKEIGKESTNQNEKVNELLSSIQTREENLLDEIKNIMSDEHKVQNELITTLNHLMEGFKHILKNLSGLTEEISSGTSNMKQVAIQLEISSQELKKATDHLSKELANIVIETRDLSHEIRDLIGEIRTNFEKVQNLLTQITNLAGSIEQTAKHAETGFHMLSDSQKKLEESLKSQFRSLEEEFDNILNVLENELGKLLNRYLQDIQSQTQERLNLWNKETQEFTRTMVDATKALAGVVDEIENRIQRSR